MIKIGLLYNTTDQPWGGINTFFRNFKRESEQSPDVELVDDFSKADIILTSGHYSAPGKILTTCGLRNCSLGRSILNPLGFLPKRGKAKIVFRLDGLRIFYRKEYSRVDELLLKNLSIADAVVFQSEHCKTIFDSIKADRPKTETVILNGANSANFKPLPTIQKLSTDTPLRLVANSWSRDRCKGFQTVAKFSELKNVEVSHIGRWSADIPSGKVKLLGTKQESEIADILRTAHFLLFPSENDACPNIVVEALASGIPVLYHNSGGTPELCGNGRYGLPMPEDSANYADFIADAQAQYCELRRNIINDIEKFTFTRCFNHYIEFFKQCLEGRK